jgi:glycosyltransferase involved in cell wall biosynthesis
MNPLVSIIVPCYNQAAFLPETLDSVIKQVYSNWECIVVDDGSPDNTSQVVAEFASRDQRISCIRKSNGGLSDARNFGVNHSKGKYILPLDADDRIGPGYLKLAIESLEKDASLRVAYPKAEYFGARQGPWQIGYTNYTDLLLSNSIYCTAMYRRSDYDRVGGYDTSLKTGFEDWEFWIRLLENDDQEHSWVYLIPGVHFYYWV